MRPPIPVLGIPTLNQAELLARCLRSIDYPITRLVLVLNGGQAQLSPEAYAALNDLEVGGFNVIRHPNAGVAGSWNEIVKLFPAAWWLICNDDIEFAPDDLAKMAQKLEANRMCSCDPPHPEGHYDYCDRSSERTVGLWYGNHGASWFGVTAAAISTAGLWDENLHPAYLEDCDMSRRMELLGVRCANVPDVRSGHGVGGHGSRTVNASPELARENARTHGGNFEYYRRKWGGLNGTETYATPFNDPHWPVWAWRFEPDTRARQQWKIS